MTGMKILVVDDERAVRESLRRALALEGYDVELAGDGEEALVRLQERPEPDVVVLDVLMPRTNGLEVCRRLRAAGNRVPVLMLTARDQVEDRVAGLDAGADDYVVKPFALEELLARVRALLRRAAPGGDEPLRFADLELDPKAHVVRRGGEEIELTVTRDGRQLRVDGAFAFGGVPRLEQLLGPDGGVVRAVRVDGPAWEVEVTRL